MASSGPVAKSGGALYVSDVVTKRNPVFLQNQNDEGRQGTTQSDDYLEGYSRGRNRIGVIVRTAGSSDTEDEDDDYYSSSYSASYSASPGDSDRAAEPAGDESESPRTRRSRSDSSIEENYAEVSWFGHSISGTALEHHDNLELIDRPIYFGEVVSSVDDAVTGGCTGVVTGARMTVDLLTLDDKIIRQIDTRNICHVRSHRPGLWVLSIVGNPWLGRVEDIQEDIIVEFRDGSKCRIKHNKFHKIETYNDTYWTEETSRSDFEGRDCRFYPGQRIKIKDRKVLESAQWLAGAQSDHKRGVICKIETSSLEVRWLMPIPTCGEEEYANLPPPIDMSPTDVVSLGFDEFCNTDWCIGDWCLFSSSQEDGEDEEGGATGRNGGNGASGREEAERKRKLMVVLCSHTVCDVRWQNGTLTKNVKGKDLVALKHCDDSDFWPNDFVVMRQELSLPNQPQGGASARRSGVVQVVNHKARTAVVKWQKITKNVEEFVLGEDETVSLYALDTHPDFGHYGIGSMVILLDVDRARERSGQLVGPLGAVENAHGTSVGSKASTASIFGQIRALNNGRLHIVWADGTMSLEYPPSVFCIDKDDLESMMSDYDSYSYSETSEGSYNSATPTSGSWETVSDDAAAAAAAAGDLVGEENVVADQARLDEVLSQAQREEDSMAQEEALATLRRLRELQVGEATATATATATTFGDGAVGGEEGPPESASGSQSHAGGEQKKSILNKIYKVFGFKKSEPGGESADQDRAATSSGGARQLERSPSQGLKDIIKDDAEGQSQQYNTGKLVHSDSLRGLHSPETPGAGASPASQSQGSSPASQSQGSRDSGIVSEDEMREKNFEALLTFLASKHDKFEILTKAAEDHHFKRRNSSGVVGKMPRTILKEWSILKKGLPDGIWVKAYEDRMDLMRALIVGAPGTPYHYGGESSRPTHRSIHLTPFL